MLETEWTLAETQSDPFHGRQVGFIALMMNDGRILFRCACSRALVISMLSHGQSSLGHLIHGAIINVSSHTHFSARTSEIILNI